MMIFYMQTCLIILKPLCYMYVFAKSIYNEHIRPYFLSHIVSTIFVGDLPKVLSLYI